MRKIVEKYSDVIWTDIDMVDFATQVVKSGIDETDKSSSIWDILTMQRLEKTGEILLSEVKEDDVICMQYKSKRFVSTYTDDDFAEVVDAEFQIPLIKKASLNETVQASLVGCYVAKNYKQALKWMFREE